jgi:hypothetical protein
MEHDGFRIREAVKPDSDKLVTLDAKGEELFQGRHGEPRRAARARCDALVQISRGAIRQVGGDRLACARVRECPSSGLGGGQRALEGGPVERPAVRREHVFNG